MAEFRRLPMHVEEARRLAAAEARAGAMSADWCVAQLRDSDAIIWRYVIPRLRHAHAVYPEVADRILELAAPPQARFGLRAAKSDADALLRLRANLALLWLEVDAGLAPVVQALEGSDRRLRAAALEGVSSYRGDLRWPDRYVEVIFDSCRRIFDSTEGMDRMHVVGVLFERPVPSLADAMREYVATTRDFRQHRAAIWLLGQGYENDARPWISRFLARPFPQDPEERASWYGIVKSLTTAMQDYHAHACLPAARAWAAATVLILIDRLAGAAQVEGEPDIGASWYSVTPALHAIRADIPPAALPLLARWAQGHSAGGLYRPHAFIIYASHAGEAAVDALLQELVRTDTSRQAGLVRQLRTLTPASRYPALVPVLRAMFDAIPPQEENSYGHSHEQEALAALAAALAQFDRGAGAYVEPRLVELGPVQAREVSWALAGLTPQRIAALLAEGGAIAPFLPGELLSFQGDGNLVRDMLRRQDRLAVFNSRDDDIDATVVRVVKKLARVCMPSVALDAVLELQEGGVRFVHADSVFEIADACDEEYAEAAAAFDAFLADIQHPQRVFMIGNDGGNTDNDAGAFFCADPVRMQDAAARIGFPISAAGDG